MDSSVSRLAKVLGASGLESAGHDARFSVEGSEGSCLKVSSEGDQQRLMGVIVDGAGVTRATLDVAPVTYVTEAPGFPGRVSLHLGKTIIHIDTQPSLAIEVVSVDPE
jgi:hypothetical protein